MRKYQSFREFWPFYLREHAKRRTRGFHYAGTSLVVLLAAAAVVTANWWLLVAMPVAGYSFAWASHAAIERNRPATFTYPGWSLRADFRMWWLWLTGRLGPELRAAGVRPDGTVEQPAERV
ncbi:MAG: DUF962 domain-containing protein [Pseudomonadota bacterium]|nr:DUF962 domain-containing protein [Pseudomonadota bacterium]